MKTTIGLMAAVVLVAAGGAFGQRSSAPRNSAAYSPSAVGSPRGPLQGRLTPTPQYRPNAGQDIVTGNVGGGKQFRGTVPYGDTTRFRSSLSDPYSSSVESFIRRSVGSPYSYGNASPESQFYYPQDTVTSLYRGNVSGLTRPQLPPQYEVPDYTAPRNAQSEGLYYRQEPLSTPSARMEELINQQRGIRDVAWDYLYPREQEDLEKRAARTRPSEELLLPDAEVDSAEQAEQLEALEPIGPDEPVTPQNQGRKLREMMEQERLESLLPEMDAERTEPQKDAAPGAAETPAGETDGAVEEAMRGLTPGQQARVKATLRGYQDYQSLARDKYGDYMAQAAEYMKQGKYYKAADTYALAGVWRKTPQMHLQRSMALFAAGSYLSAAGFLRQAYQMDPETALKFDPAAAIVERDDVEDRLIELQGVVDNVSSSHLAMLAAYFYYRDGQTDRALEAINRAAELAPEDAVIASLRQTIQAAANKK